MGFFLIGLYEWRVASFCRRLTYLGVPVPPFLTKTVQEMGFRNLKYHGSCEFVELSQLGVVSK